MRLWLLKSAASVGAVLFMTSSAWALSCYFPTETSVLQEAESTVGGAEADAPTAEVTLEAVSFGTVQLRVVDESGQSGFYTFDEVN